MKSTVDAAVIVPTLGRVDRALQLARNLGKLEPQPAEIIFVFQVAEELAQFRKSIQTAGIRSILSPRVGQGVASNWGASQANSCFLAFLDDDCIPVDSSWLQRLIEPLQEPRTLLSTGAVSNWTNASGSRPWMKSAHRLAPPFLTPWGNPASTKSSWCDGVAGGNFAVKKSVFIRAGGFSEEFGSPCLYQETELALRITSRRRRSIWYSGSARVFHEQEPNGGHRNSTESPSEDFLIEQKRLLLLLVYGPGLSSAMRLRLYRFARRARVLLRALFLSVFRKR